MAEETKLVALTRAECEVILDSVRVSNPQTRELALKAAGLVLEWAAEDAVQEADKATMAYGTVRAE